MNERGGRLLSQLDGGVIGALWKREMLRYARDRAQWFGGISRTVLWLIILGVGLGAALREIEGYTYVQYILPGVVVLNVLFASLHSAVALVWDREAGLMREILVSPAPMLSVAAGKVLGGASIAVIQGSIPLFVAPFIGIDLTISRLVIVWTALFALGVFATSLGLIVATRISTLEGFGAISNGIIQPLYFLSGAIFPLRGVIGGVGILEIPIHLREELSRIGVYAIGGGWLVQLPVWIQIPVYLNPVSYGVDFVRYLLMDFHQLPLISSILVVYLLPIVAMVIAARAMGKMRET